MIISITNVLAFNCFKNLQQLSLDEKTASICAVKCHVTPFCYPSFGVKHPSNYGTRTYMFNHYLKNA